MRGHGGGNGAMAQWRNGAQWRIAPKDYPNNVDVIA